MAMIIFDGFYVLQFFLIALEHFLYTNKMIFLYYAPADKFPLV